MEKQLKLDFEKTFNSSNFSQKKIEIKKDFLKKFIKNGFPNREIEDWKFSDIRQIIEKNIGELSFYTDYSFTNKINTSMYIEGLEHNKIVFINGRVEKIDFEYEDSRKIEILDENDFKSKVKNENSLINLNNAFSNKYYKIVVKENYSLKKPLVIYQVTTEKMKGKNINIRILVPMKILCL